MMKHRHRHGMSRHFTHHDNPFCEIRGPLGHGGGRHGGRPGGTGHGPEGRKRRGARLFDYGELRLLVLALIAKAPAHGYELIKTIEERFGGSYTPSPGVIYPTLSWLDDMGYATVEAEAGRKSYAITPAGQAFLDENHDAAEALFQRSGDEGRPVAPGDAGDAQPEDRAADAARQRPGRRGRDRRNCRRDRRGGPEDRKDRMSRGHADRLKD
jgi:DNA-binding PadR family transcriptional regulator